MFQYTISIEAVYVASTPPSHGAGMSQQHRVKPVMCKYDDEGALGSSGTGTCTWAVRGGNVVPESKKADLSLEAPARQPRVAFENLTTGFSYKRGIIMSLQLHNLGCDCQLLTRDDKNVSLVWFEDIVTASAPGGNYFRRIFSIALPFANSSISLSR